MDAESIDCLLKVVSHVTPIIRKLRNTPEKLKEFIVNARLKFMLHEY